MNSELLRIIEAIHHEKDIESELIFTTIEQAMVEDRRRDRQAAIGVSDTASGNRA